MKCDEINELISLYIDNELDGTQRRNFEEHIESCGSCRREVAEITKLVQACSEIDEEELPDRFAEELHARLVAVDGGRSREKKLLSFPGKSVKTISAIAAGFVIIFIAGFLIKGMLLTPSKTESSARDMALADQASEKSVQNGNSATGQAETAAEQKSQDEAGSSSKTDASGNNDVKVTFNDSADTDGSSKGNASERAGVPADTSGSSNAKVGIAAGTGETVKGSVDQSDGASRATPDLKAVCRPKFAAAVDIAEKKVASFVIHSEDINTLTAGVDKVMLDNGGEAVAPDNEKVMGIAATTTSQQPADQVSMQYRIQPARYEALKNSLISLYGQENIEVKAPETQDMTAELNALITQSNELDSQIKQAESKETALNEEEIEKLSEEKKSIDTQIEDIRLQADFTYITVTIEKNKK